MGPVIPWELWPVVSPLFGRSRMPSVVGLLEQHELAARRRVDELREEADRVQAELAAAEQEWQEWVIARRRVDTVLAPDDADTAEDEAAADPQNDVAPSTGR